MASIRLRAVSGASLLIVPDVAGTSFHIENCGAPDGSQDVPDLLLTSGPEGVRISVLRNPSTSCATSTSSLEAEEPVWTLPQPESFNLTSEIEETGEYSREIEQLGLLFPTGDFSVDAIEGTFDFPVSTAEETNREFDFATSWTLDVTDMFTRGHSPVLDSTSSSSTPSDETRGSSVADRNSPSPSIADGGHQPVALVSGLACRVPGCSRICLREHTRKKHEEAHASKAPLSCSEPGCSTTFSRPHDKLRHEVRKHGYPSHTCSVCNSFFSYARGLEKHKCHAVRK